MAKADPKTFVFDFDETITKAPKLMVRIASALKSANNDRIVVLTGNQSPRPDLVKRLNDFGFPFDDLIQYDDEGSDGSVRAGYLKQLDTWCGIDNRADRAHTYAEIAPHLYLITKAAKMSKDQKQDSKAGAKKDVKKQMKRLLLTGGPCDGQTFETRGMSDLIETEDGHTYRISLDGSTARYEPTDRANYGRAPGQNL